MEWCFVRPEKDAIVSENLQSAYNLMVENDLNPKWIDAEQCLSLTTEKIKVKTTFFVCDPFSGQAFKHLKIQKCRILGPKYVKEAAENGQVQNVPYPIYNSVMAGLRITYTGFKAGERQELMEKIQYMGGQTTGQYTAQITHLIADGVGSKKYQVAVEFNTPVMLSSWVTECWKRCQNEDIRATDTEFDRFRTPIFKGLVITLTQADFDERKRIQDLVVKHGGKYTGELRSRDATHLIAWEPTGKKFVHATRWGIYCVTPDWLDDCVKKGYKVKEELYILKKLVDSQPVTSSPQRGTTSKDELSANLTASFISSSAVDETYVSSRNSSICRPNDPASASTALESLEMATVYRAGSTFLDGCRFFLCGFDSLDLEKVRRIINLGGGSRLNQLSELVSHCLVNSGACKIDEVVSEMEAKRWRPKVVKVEWLVDSCLAAFVVDEKPYLLWEPPASKMLPPEPEKEAPEWKSIDSDTAMEDQKILSQYLETSSQGNNFNDTVGLETDQTTFNGDEEQTEKLLFYNITMTVLGFSKESLTCLYQTVNENGGHILSPEDGAQVPDYTIVPIEGIKNLKNVSKVATNVWLLTCVEKRSIVPLDSDPLYQPIYLDLRAKPLAGCVLCISQFMDTERESLSELAVLLGAKYQDTLVRKANIQSNLLRSTHLICMDAEGGKYRGAVRWNVPVVNKNWLTDCAAQGKWLPEKEYYVGVSEGPETSLASLQSKSIKSPSKNLDSVKKKQKKSEVLARPSNNSTSFLLNKSDFTDLKTPQTVKRNDVNIERSFENIKRTFTPGSAKPKRVTELVLDLQNSSGRKGENSDSVKASTPARFLNTSTNFEPKLTFSPDDCVKNQSNDGIGSLENFFRDNLQSAKDKSKPFGALAKFKPRESGAFFPDEVEKTGPLKDVIMGVSKKLRSDQGKLNDMISGLGGDYRWTFDRTCTHFVYQGKLTENWSDLKQAKAKGIPIVAPEWLYACLEKNAKMCENSYPCNLNPKMTLDISTSQIERPRTLQSQIPSATSTSECTPKRSQSAGKESLVVNGAEKSIENQIAADGEPLESKYKGSRKLSEVVVSREIGAIFAMTCEKSTEKSRVFKITSPTSSNVSGEGPSVFPIRQTADNEIRGVSGEPSQSIPIVWGDLAGKGEKEAGDTSPTGPICVDDETQMEHLEMSAVKPKDNETNRETAFADSKNSNKENNALKDGEMIVQEAVDEERPKTIPRFMLSGFKNDDRIRCEEMIESLEGMVSKHQSFDGSCTHLIVHQPSRNEKCLASIVSGKWMLHQSYLTRCIEEQTFVDEALYEWGGEGMKENLATIHPQMRKIAASSRKWRMKLEEEGEASKPFSRWNVIIHTEKTRFSSFKRVLEAGGAEISSCKYPFSDQLNQVTHAFLELNHESIPVEVDLTALLDAKILCLKPEFIASYLMDDNTNARDFYISEVRSIPSLKTNESATNVSKRKSNSLNTSNKRNRRI